VVGLSTELRVFRCCGETAPSPTCLSWTRWCWVYEQTETLSRCDMTTR